MSEESALDLETLRKSRIDRLEAELHELASRLTHLHWPSTEAEVTDCRKMKFRYRYYAYRVPNQMLSLRGYAVGFRYSVEGRSYAGVLDSPVEVEPGDRFSLRYNPDHPDENNSICSNSSMGSLYSAIVTAVLAGLILFLFIKEHFFKS